MRDAGITSTRGEHVRHVKPQVGDDYCTSPIGKVAHYLTAATPAQQRSVEAIVADAQHDLIRRAHPPAILTDGETAELARDYPHLVATLGLDDMVLAELAGGERDVFPGPRPCTAPRPSR